MSFKFHYTVYSGLELRDRLEQAGFTDIKLYGSLAGAPHGPAAERLIVTARDLSSSKVAVSRRARFNRFEPCHGCRAIQSILLTYNI